MTIKLLTEHHLEFLSLKGGCTGSSEFTHVKMLEITCCGSYGLAHKILVLIAYVQMPLIKTHAEISSKASCLN